MRVSRCPAPSFSSSCPIASDLGDRASPAMGCGRDFPNYRYDDLVAAQHRLLTDHLRIGHLRLVLGLSMGGMLTWLWGEMFPDFMDALVPVACQPGPMSGRNWIQRRMAIEAIRNDPGWQGGDYKQQPTNYALTPIGAIFTQSVVRIQELAPTRAEADAFYGGWLRMRAKATQTTASTNWKPRWSMTHPRSWSGSRRESLRSISQTTSSIHLSLAHWRMPWRSFPPDVSQYCLPPQVRADTIPRSKPRDGRHSLLISCATNRKRDRALSLGFWGSDQRRTRPSHAPALTGAPGD